MNQPNIEPIKEAMGYRGEIPEDRCETCEHACFSHTRRWECRHPKLEEMFAVKHIRVSRTGSCDWHELAKRAAA